MQNTTKKISLALFILLIIAATAVQADEEFPEWVTREGGAWVEEGIIYARASARMASTAMATSTANSRARTALSRALVNGELTDYAAIPADVKARTTFNYNGNSVVVGDFSVKDTFVDDDGYTWVLVACSGAEMGEER